MTAIQSRSTVLAVKVEASEGTPLAPTSAEDFMALQDDGAMAPETEVLENAELKNSLGKAKSIVGLENPTFSFSHYLRHSGVEGTAPDFKELLEGAFGSEVVASTQYDTVAGSTTSIINVDAGEGVNFQRGQALLIKDATNGYSIRPVQSVSVDALTLGFNVAVAPASGVNLGKAILYKPAEADHQSFSIWHYLGNGGATQLMSGAKMTSLGISIEAGQLINASYNLEGVGYYFNPVVIAAADRYLDFTDDNGTFAAIVSAKFYKSPKELASALQTAMNLADPLETFTVTYSDSTGKFTIATTTSAVLTLKWSTGANTANTIGDKIGFVTASDDSAATTYTSDNAQTFAAPYTPSLDASDPLVAKYNEALIGDATDTSCFAASTVDVTMDLTRRQIQSICAESGVSGSVINAREVTIAVKALLNKYDVDKYERYRVNQQTKFLYNFGTKTGGNWNAGYCGMIYAPTATITAFSIEDDDGLFALNLELKTYVDSSGNGEFYLNFV